ncbi:hypothetical protein OUZ56_012182 [Daphnia magna]|uniref:Uncharacterized protein n=1 Tax=Daphnia magna TaxID=35525 RepID=A0ABQ9Z295_9CRUS|nr:hypothetical protein OUZ56_012182 [Daphnia magna]
MAETNNRFETTGRGQASSTTSINAQRCACFHWFERVHVTFAAWKKVDYLEKGRLLEKGSNCHQLGLIFFFPISADRAGKKTNWGKQGEIRGQGEIHGQGGNNGQVGNDGQGTGIGKAQKLQVKDQIRSMALEAVPKCAQP